jgi:hypothetical protein
MEYRPQNLAAQLMAGLVALAFVVGAQADDPAHQDDLASAQAMQAKAESLRKAADARLEEENAACTRKFLENDCRNAARERHLESIRASRRLAAQGREMEYRVRVRERESKRRERAARAEKKKAAAPECRPQESCDDTTTAP